MTLDLADQTVKDLIFQHGKREPPGINLPSYRFWSQYNVTGSSMLQARHQPTSGKSSLNTSWPRAQYLVSGNHNLYPKFVNNTQRTLLFLVWEMTYCQSDNRTVITRLANWPQHWPWHHHYILERHIITFKELTQWTPQDLNPVKVLEKRSTFQPWQGKQKYNYFLR